MLIEHGAEVNRRSLVGDVFYAPIFLASTEATIQLLLEKGADANIRMSDGSMVLHCMSAKGNETGIRAILSQVKGMADNVNVTNKNGKSPLIYATVEGHEKVAKLLLQFGANVNTGRTDLGGNLIQAITTGYENLAELYIQHNADLNARDSIGDTAVLVAFKRGRMATVDRLVNAGVNLSAAISDDPKAWEPVQDKVLMWASEFGHASIVELLFKQISTCSISYTIKNAALNMAEDKGYSTIVDIFESFGGFEDPSKDKRSGMRS
ncbi:hypothetical protein CGLO_04456 [Colletotrichum gloeosporioides Cg-14]|uniref:Uncharacterized protein n=1 Tax=Colletotrichum gloeosporioides (strain Cg-14) TaxID=1237896 RepID=T0M493_COLGC|nr:hypothetical protein CGLO_04456 [Colletotrichum gloeosporioides Cg-14]